MPVRARGRRGSPPRASAAFGGVDWAGIWRRGRRWSGSTPARWDARAPTFGRGGDGTFASEVVRLLDPAPGWTALDVGCGTGALALPLAERIRRVTALDFSPAMLDLLRRRAAERGLRNVRRVLGAWADDWKALGLAPHDLVVASRSLLAEDLPAALRQLDAFARRRACVVAPVGDGPTDRRVVEATGRAFRPGPDFLPVLGTLLSLGRFPRLEYVSSAPARVFASRDEALETLAWTVRGCTAAERGRLARWLDRTLVPSPRGLELPGRRTIRWAVLCWDKEEDP
jgi:SAM-dependent methyltransferase